MKVAICISGHLRTFRDNWTLTKHLIAPNGADVFVHTYPLRNVSTGPVWHADSAGHNDLLSKEDLERIDALGPKLIRIDPLPDGAAHLPEPLKTMGYRWSWQEVNKLRREREESTGTRYDAVFMARFDLFLHEPLMLQLPERGTVYGGYNGNQARQGNDGEIFFYGRPETVDAMTIPAIPDEERDRVPGYGLVGEIMFTSIRRWHRFRYEPVRTKYALLRSHGFLEIEQ